MSEKLKNFLQELFLVLGAVIGMGFASGKEISRFFCYNKTLALTGVFLFIILFILFFNLITKFKKKFHITNFNLLNEKLFKNNSKYIKILLLIIYSISASCMLSGANLLINSIFSINFSFFSIFLSIILFFIIIGGIKRIKNIFSKILPYLLILIFINLFVNLFNSLPNSSSFFSFNFSALSVKDWGMSILLPITFFGGNLILAIDAILASKSKATGYLSSAIFFVFLIMGCGVVFLLGADSMPFLVASKNLSSQFYFLYFIAIFLALFSSLVISTHNIVALIGSKDKLVVLIILLINQSLSFLGFDFIVNYLYTFTGLLGLIYIIFAVIRMTYLLNKK